MDVVFVGLLVLLCVLTAGLGRLCASLMGRRS
jgi:hypothetical protein